MTDITDFHKTRLPEGVKDFLPGSARRIECMQGILAGVYAAWGYGPVMAPSLEYLAVLERGLGESLREKTFRFDDRQSGKLVAYSPDITPQVARIVATRMKDFPLPQRLCYSGRVLRYTERDSGKEREIFQSGAELIGHKSLEADAEMVAMAVEGFRALGAGEFSIDIGQVEFFHGVMRRLGLPPDQARPVQEAIGRKDTPGLESLLSHLDADDPRKKEALALTRLYGGREVLDRAEAAVTNPESRGALNSLRRVLELLDGYGVSDHITFDLGEIRGLDYHTGIIFQGYLKGLGREVCSGGRYDNLVERYGFAVPATGFTFNLLGLLASLGDEIDARLGQRRAFLVRGPEPGSAEALELAAALRRRNHTAVSEIASRSLEESLDYGRMQGFTAVMVVEENGKTVKIIRLRDNHESRVAFADALALEF